MAKSKIPGGDDFLAQPRVARVAPFASRQELKPAKGLINIDHTSLLTDGDVLMNEETYMLINSPAADGGMALFKLDYEAAKKCYPVQSTEIDREFAPSQLYVCDRSLVTDHGLETVRLAPDETDHAVYTLMLVSQPSSGPAVILTSLQFDREGQRGGPAEFIEPFLEILEEESVEALTSHARRLLREKSEPRTLLKKDGSSMTYDEMLDLLL